MNSKEIINNIKDNILLPLKQTLISNKNFEKSVIVRVDGGIASQIVFYLLGKYFSDKNINVKYDLEWFTSCGMDLQNKFVRNFDFEKAFPNVEVKKATEEEIKFYKKNFKLKGNNYKNKKAPLYLGSYYDFGNLLKHYQNFLIENFNPELDEENRIWLEKIKGSNACGIHVRRGDLSQGNVAYGSPATPEYFVKSINYVKSKFPNSKFFFFSDEVDWIKSEILPKLENTEFEIVDCNGSDRGYLDLYLLSNCKNFITSIGSFGKFASILSNNKKEDSITILSKGDKSLFSSNLIKNIVIGEDIND